MQPAFRRVALIGKLRSAEIAVSLRQLTEFLRARGCEVLIEQETALDAGMQGSSYEALGASADLAVVIGGDGTMLAAARNLVRHRVPVVGVNLDRVGFMKHHVKRSTPVTVEEMKEAIEQAAVDRHLRSTKR